MTETVIATGNNVKFIEGVTEMTQANWQEYFGKQFENRVIEGFNPRKSTDATAVIYDGSVFVNGIYAKLELEGGSKNIYVLDSYDTFLCLRVYFDEEKVELVKKTVATGSSESDIADIAMHFIADESYQCTRNDTIYEIPLFYCGASYYTNGFDLRRHGVLNENLYGNRILSGNNTYVLKDPNQGADFLIKAYIDLVNLAEDVDIYLYSPSGSSGATFAISWYPLQDLHGWYDMIAPFIDPSDGWTSDVASASFKRSIVSGSLTRIKVKLVDSYTQGSGSSAYPVKAYAIKVL